jgi:hypothetical protein
LPPQSELLGTQQLLAQLIRAPENVERTLAVDRAGGGTLARALDAVVRSDARMSAADRLEVYANAYFQRILEALREDYAALAAALGDDHFHNLVTGYLLVFPSRFPSMRDVGGRLARFIEQREEGKDIRERFPWAGALARLEWALVEAFDAADCEAARREDYVGLAPERFAGLRFELQPGAQRLAFDWPVVGLRRRYEREVPLALAELAATLQHALVWRHEERVFYRQVDAAEAAALEGLTRGLHFAELCGIAAEHVGEEAAPGHTAAWLARWLEDGCLVRDASLLPA